jgi:tRNA threonylcarbamoyladenosine biosynthesis protein TsaB
MSESWLLIETSGRIGKVGLARGGSVARAADLDATRRHARDLTPTVDALLKAEGIGPRDLTGVMVSVGPGSYTGLRVGVMAAKALAYATGCGLVPVGTFAAIAEQAPADANVLWVIADALQGQVYFQRFERSPESGRLVPSHPHLWQGQVQIGPAEEWLNWLPAGVWVSGPGVKVYADRNIPPTCNLVPEADREPSVAGLFTAGLGLAPVSREELFALEPLYLRGSSAEEKAKKEKPPG